ncbi:MAG: phosphodiester glycosidase family protein [Dysgonamonadaceae bacterium]|nr:phosphodiester glycosidase family protein [Dysgonamonadaceae bacterium]
MKHREKIGLLSVLLLTVGLFAFSQNSINDQILTYTVDTKTQDLKFYWKTDKGIILKSIQNLKNYVESKDSTLIFAMNGGMFNKNFYPQGLFIQNKNTLSVLDTTNGNGNFYLKPNGVFYVTTDNLPFICETTDFEDNGQIKYATQSGPMLIIDGQIHSAFKEGSKNLNIRNGVGILPNNKVIFAMSKKEINFYDFAMFFQNLGCKNALYLDGFVSRTYLPEKNWKQTDGNFGVIIGVTKKTER